LPFGDKRHVWVEGKPALMPVSLSWEEGVSLAKTPPDVKRGPVDFPPLTLSYAFAGLNERGWVKIAARLDWGEGPKVLREIALAPDAGGTVIVPLAGGRVAIKPIPAPAAALPARAEIELREPLKDDSPIVY
jgi:hypothetical protein